MHVGKRIRARMNEIPGLTTKVLAERLEMHEQTVYDIFKRDNVSSDLLLKISKVLQTPVTYFLEDVDSNPTQLSIKIEAPPKPDDTSSPPSEELRPKIQQLVPPVPLPQPTVLNDISYKSLYEEAQRRIQQLESHLKDKDLIIKLLLEKLG